MPWRRIIGGLLVLLALSLAYGSWRWGGGNGFFGPGFGWHHGWGYGPHMGPGYGQRYGPGWGWQRPDQAPQAPANPPQAPAPRQ